MRFIFKLKYKMFGIRSEALFWLTDCGNCDWLGRLWCHEMKCPQLFWKGILSAYLYYQSNNTFDEFDVRTTKCVGI